MENSILDYADKTIQFTQDLGVQYCDVRAEDQTLKSVLIENQSVEHARESNDIGLEIRLIKNRVWAFCSITNPESREHVKDKISETVKNAQHYGENKQDKIRLAPNNSKKITIDYTVINESELEEITKLGFECSKIISDTPRIIKSIIHSRFMKNSKYFVSTEGAKILQNFTDLVMDMNAISHESGLTQSVNIIEGGRDGIEQITENDKIQNVAKEVSQKDSQLINAEPVKEEKTIVVMNPDFVALLTHEILDHPSEDDRVLEKEMVWAGGAWWKGKRGEKIGSEHLTVFDDPIIEQSLGWYQYDDEGVRTKKTTLVENGFLKEHMQNRETAEIFDSIPTGNMRTTSYRFMPLIRMACTCIAPGEYNPEEIIKDVKDGYHISNMEIPSINMKRFNWSISAQYAQKIEDDELTDLKRDIIVTGVAPEFFESIDACGKDFTVRPITNCGKGDPMQLMIMGNGKPTIRGIATIKSVN